MSPEIMTCGPSPGLVHPAAVNLPAPRNCTLLSAAVWHTSGSNRDHFVLEVASSCAAKDLAELKEVCPRTQTSAFSPIRLAAEGCEIVSATRLTPNVNNPPGSSEPDPRQQSMLAWRDVDWWCWIWHFIISLAADGRVECQTRTSCSTSLLADCDPQPVRPFGVNFDFAITHAAEQVPLFQIGDGPISRSYLECYAKHLFFIILAEA